MNSVINNYIAEKQLSGSLRESLESLDERDANVIADLIVELQPSANALRDIQQLALETAKRDEIAISDLLSLETLHSIFDPSGDSAALNRKEKFKRLKTWLTEKRYPYMTAVRTELDQETRELVKTYGIRLQLPDELEGDTVSVELKARSIEELREVAQTFQALSDDPRAARVFSLLRGQVAS